MEARIMLKLTHEDVQEKIPYGIVCETYCREIFRTGRAKRLRKERFTDAEWERCLDLCKLAYKWFLKTGVPDEVTMSARTFALWLRLAEFCAAL